MQRLKVQDQFNQKVKTIFSLSWWKIKMELFAGEHRRCLYPSRVFSSRLRYLLEKCSLDHTDHIGEHIAHLKVSLWSHTVLSDDFRTVGIVTLLILCKQVAIHWTYTCVYIYSICIYMHSGVKSTLSVCTQNTSGCVWFNKGFIT